MGIAFGEGDVDANGAEEVNLRDAAGAELIGQKTLSASLPVAIASNQSAYPVNQGSAATIANGWPTKITDGTNTLIVNSDGSINVTDVIAYHTSQGTTYILSGSFNAASGGSDNPILLIKNPNGSGKTLYLQRVAMNVSVTNVIVDYKFFYAPTITSNGTSQTPRNALIGSSSTSAMTCFSLPTLSSNGTQLVEITVGQNATTCIVDVNGAIQMQANQNLVIAAQPASNNRAVQFTVTWVER